MGMAQRYTAVIVDLDGCVYRGGSLIPGSREALEGLEERGVRVLFLTNNSTMTAEDYCIKLGKMGIRCRSEMVLTSGEAAALHILRESGRSRILAVTGRGFVEYCRRAGHRVIPLERWKEAEYVVVGLDREFDYEKLRAAVKAVMAGARFIATNADRTLPTSDGFDPGAGSIVAAIREAAGVNPVIIGKPSRIIMEMALERVGVGAGEALVVGDRVETDVMAGKSVGADTALVLSGATSREDLEKIPPEHMPDYVAENLLELYKMLQVKDRI